MKLARRHILRGAGVALALPWLESLAPKRARGQAARPRRFVPVFFPQGAGAYWRPAETGAGDAWQLSPILEPFAPLKRKVTVLSHVDPTANAASKSVGALGTGAFLTCAPCSAEPISNGISLDQRLARDLVGQTPLSALQVGLSTLDSYAAGLPGAFSRSISWASPTQPMFKIVNPQEVFDRLVSGGVPGPGVDAAARARWEARKSVLDFVAGNASSLRPRLGVSDRQRFDQFLVSVREVEKRLEDPVTAPGTSCAPIAERPTLSVNTGQTPPDYDRGAHATVMIDLIVMALSCDLTRVVSFMMDDARSDFVYNFLSQRRFTSAGSIPGPGFVGGLHAASLQGETNDGWATIDWWFASKAAELCLKLDAVPDGPGQTLLDNSLVWFGSGQHDDDHAEDLRVLYAGSGGGVLKTDLHLDFAPSTRLANVYLTFLKRVFGASDAAFGDSTDETLELLA